MHQMKLAIHSIIVLSHSTTIRSPSNHVRRVKRCTTVRIARLNPDALSLQLNLFHNKFHFVLFIGLLETAHFSSADTKCFGCQIPINRISLDNRSRCFHIRTIHAVCILVDFTFICKHIILGKLLPQIDIRLGQSSAHSHNVLHPQWSMSLSQNRNSFGVHPEKHNARCHAVECAHLQRLVKQKQD